MRTGLAPYLERFEGGLRTEVGETARRLSAGERQVIGLLRAVVGVPSVLIVDEGLNALDLETSLLVHSFIRYYAANHAVLIVSHDPSVLMGTDYLYVLRAGLIHEEGLPSALANRDGTWAKAWASHAASMKGIGAMESMSGVLS
jgi:ABC-type multidrug transport system fused ATPase/permease subunit